MDSDEHDDYRWKPAPEDWDQLRSLAEGVAQWPREQLPALIQRTFECLGFSKQEADELAASETGQRRFAVEAAARIREGSRRLGKAIVAPDPERQELLEAVAETEPVLFYRELAENHLASGQD